MSETDSFIDEVTEEVRRDRLFGLFRRYGWIAILLVLAVVGGAAWNEWGKARDRADAQAMGDTLLAALEADSPEARSAALSQITAKGGQAAVVGFLAASEALAGGDTAAAAERLSAVATDMSLPESYRSLAALKRVMALGDTMDPAERNTVLEMLAQPGQVLRPLAMEQQALALLASGDEAGAVEKLRALLVEPELTLGLRQRATQLMVALGADPDAA